MRSPRSPGTVCHIYNSCGTNKANAGMRKISTREMREALPHLEELLAREGELVITRRGEPVARVMPVSEARVRPSHARLRAGMARAERGSEEYVRRDRNAR